MSPTSALGEFGSAPGSARSSRRRSRLLLAKRRECPLRGQSRVRGREPCVSALRPVLARSVNANRARTLIEARRHVNLGGIDVVVGREHRLDRGTRTVELRKNVTRLQRVARATHLEAVIAGGSLLVETGRRKVERAEPALRVHRQRRVRLGTYCAIHTRGEQYNTHQLLLHKEPVRGVCRLHSDLECSDGMESKDVCSVGRSIHCRRA